MGSFWMIVAIMAPVAIVGVGIIALISRYDREVEDGLRAQEPDERWMSLT
jgi:hypothetical protein